MIIFLAVWNALTMPFAFAYPLLFSTNTDFTISDHIIDSLFGLDIVMNFRTGFRDSKTDELILNPKTIAINYMYGRFWVDFFASLPLESIVLLFASSSSATLKIFSLMKLIRLLRLGRIVTYLKMN